MLRRERNSKKKDKGRIILSSSTLAEIVGALQNRVDGSAEDGISYGKSLPMGS